MANSEEYDWQQNQNTVDQRDTFILDNEQWTDCTFTVGEEGSEQQIFKCHRLYMAKTSAVFAAMLYGGLKDKNAEYRITDVHPEVFTLILKYIYTGCIELNNYSNACNLLYAVKKYLMPVSLRLQCEQYLKENVNLENAWSALEFACSNDEPDIRKKVNEIIDKQFGIMLEKPGMLEVSQKTIIALLQGIDNLLVTSSLQIYEAVLRWVKNEISCRSDEHLTLQEIFQPFIPYIHFLAMSYKEIWKCTDIEQVLSSNELLGILRCISEETSVPEAGICSCEICRPHFYKVAILDKDEDTFQVIRASTLVPRNENLDSIDFCEFAEMSVSKNILGISHEVKIVGFVIPSQTTPGNFNSETYEESLTVVAYGDEEKNIIYKYSFLDTVSYNSSIEIQCSIPLNFKVYKFKVLFHKKGHYPCKYLPVAPIHTNELISIFDSIPLTNIFFTRKVRSIHYKYFYEIHIKGIDQRKT